MIILLFGAEYNRDSLIRPTKLEKFLQILHFINQFEIK